jgi:hypothetical protein
VKALYRDLRSHFRRNDVRIRRQLWRKRRRNSMALRWRSSLTFVSSIVVGTGRDAGIADA